MFKLLSNRPLIALVGAVAFPVAALLALATLPDRQRARPVVIAVQVALVIGSVVLFGLFLAKVVEQVNARRVRSWVASSEGQEWLAELPEDERAEFLDRLGGGSGGGLTGESPVDSAGDPR